ncbi:MAG: type II toxin-antitoxin system prevent-host-death family antitoxin [Gemmatimonadetes bacterium]|nr:type II toxin-antitoxin system prevent-host-death family antitoxin [Gemmatimonadota bacterium]
MKKTAAVSELKASLSRYLARVKAGEEVLVTERGKPVAKLVPVRAGVGREAERLSDLERRGLVRVGPGGLPRGFWKLPRPRDPKGLVLKGLLEDREQGR